MMNVLLTGSRGFIGEYVLKELRFRKIKVTELDCDLLESDKLPKGPFSHVIHLAARIPHLSKKYKNTFNEINYHGTKTVKDMYHDSKIVFISTVDVVRSKLSEYARSKLNAELLMDPDDVIIRLPSVFGPKQRQKKLIPLLFNKYCSGGECSINSNDIREYVYVKDVAVQICDLLKEKGIKTIEGFKIKNLELDKLISCACEWTENVSIDWRTQKFFNALVECADYYKSKKEKDEIPGSKFYFTKEGNSNARILTESIIKLNKEIIDKYKINGRVLFMGYGDGLLLKKLSGLFNEAVLIEGSKELIKRAELDLKEPDNCELIHSRFEDYNLGDCNKFDIVLANHVLEHVENDEKVLFKIKGWLKSVGYLLVSVPNAKSLHRRIGKALGMISTVYDLNKKDHKVGHKRVYDESSLIFRIISAGFSVMEVGGFNIKMLSQKQMEGWPSDLLWELYDISRRCPRDVCSNIYALCTKSEL